MFKFQDVVDRLAKDSDKLFDYLMTEVKRHDKAFVKGTWLAKAELDDSISCQDCWIEWFDNFTKLSPETVDEEGWDFYCEITGDLIIFPVYEVYRKDRKNLFRKEILNAWTMGEPVTEEELNKDQRKLFKATIKEKVASWKKNNMAEFYKEREGEAE